MWNNIMYRDSIVLQNQMPEIQWGSLQHLNETVSFITTFQTLSENACGRKNYYINNLPHMGNGVGKEHKLKYTHTPL